MTCLISAPVAPLSTNTFDRLVLSVGPAGVALLRPKFPGLMKRSTKEGNDSGSHRSLHRRDSGASREPIAVPYSPNPDETLLNHLQAGMHLCHERNVDGYRWALGSLSPTLDLVAWFDYGLLGWEVISDSTIILNYLKESDDASVQVTPCCNSNSPRHHSAVL